jgi:hypothetical protein
METAAQQLRDKEVFPSANVLTEVLGKSYPAFEELTARVTAPAYGLTMQWNYYQDGKAWLCKICDKKKTVCWLSVWDQFCKVAFYFVERHVDGLLALEIAEGIKDDFLKQKRIGKLMPLVMDITTTGQLTDLLRIIAYKKALK